MTPPFLRWQRLYLDRFDAALRAADWSDPTAASAEVMARLQDLVPGDDLAIFAQLSIEPNASALGLCRWPRVARRRSRDPAA